MRLSETRHHRRDGQLTPWAALENAAHRGEAVGLQFATRRCAGIVSVTNDSRRDSVTTRLDNALPLRVNALKVTEKQRRLTGRSNGFGAVDSERMAASGATHAFSRRPLSRAYRPFIGPIFKARLGAGFRTPARCGTVVRGGAGVRKPPKEETAERKGAGWPGASYGDLRIAEGSGVSRREPVARMVRGGNDDGEFVRSRGCPGLAGARRLESAGRPGGDVAFLVRRAADGEEKRRCEAGNAATIIMRCRS